VTNELRRSWLVQRLNTPHTGVWGKDKDNPFAFGGGLRNGGLSDTAMDLIRGIFSFDYMGAAEFEFGAVPTALDGLAKAHKQLVADTLTIPLADVARTWHDKSTGDPDGDALVYVLARAEHLDDVKQRITDIAAGNYQLKESTHLNAVLRPHADPDSRSSPTDRCGSPRASCSASRSPSRRPHDRHPERPRQEARATVRSSPPRARPRDP
jgi:hypothetical protein